jgi:hypothetical protein
MTSALAIAKHMLQQRASIVPVIYRSKNFDKWALDARGYTLADLREKLPTEEDIEYWWSSGRRNIAALTNSNLIVLDFDKVANYHLFKIKNPTLWHTMTVKSGNGFHVYFRIENDIPDGVKSAINGMECKHNGAAILLPPSIHPNGTVYQTVYTGMLNSYSILQLTSIDVLIDAGLLVLGATPPDPRPVKEKTSVVARPDIIQFLSARGHEFKQTGGDFVVTSCPFHSDDHPSFWINVATQKCNCFVESCQSAKSMDIYDLLQRMFNITFRQAKAMVG